MDDIDRSNFDHALSQMRKTRNINSERLLPHLAYTDEAFRKRYRLTKNSFYQLCDVLKKDEIKRTKKTGLPLTVEQELCIFLRVCATNSFQSQVADEFSVDQSTISRIFHKMLDKLFNLRSEFIFWPNDEERTQISQRFFNTTGIPGVVGAIDGSLIKIRAPSEEEHVYVSRKGSHSINMAAVCDDRCFFRWVVAEHPGSAADCRILNESTLKMRLERKELRGVLLGDSGYSSSDFLLTPILNPKNAAEQRFSDSLCQGRVVIEQSFGHLKRQFSCLYSILRFDPKTACKVILVCCMLRNICNRSGDPLFTSADIPAEIAAQLEKEPIDDDNNVVHSPSSNHQQFIIDKFFT